MSEQDQQPMSSVDAFFNRVDAHPGPQAIVDAETAQGFRGKRVDPTDDDAYTVAGVISGKPVPDPRAHTFEVRPVTED